MVSLRDCRGTLARSRRSLGCGILARHPEFVWEADPVCAQAAVVGHRFDTLLVGCAQAAEYWLVVLCVCAQAAVGRRFVAQAARQP